MTAWKRLAISEGQTQTRHCRWMDCSDKLEGVSQILAWMCSRGFRLARGQSKTTIRVQSSLSATRGLNQATKLAARRSTSMRKDLSRPSTSPWKACWESECVLSGRTWVITSANGKKSSLSSKTSTFELASKNTLLYLSPSGPFYKWLTHPKTNLISETQCWNRWRAL